jgi:NhaB family Na+:H+ antiporter
MSSPITSAFVHNFLGRSPAWYKRTILAFLIVNPLIFVLGGPHSGFIAGWALVVEFIFTLAMALKCYPLQPGGLLALEAVAIGMASPEAVYQETLGNFPVILLLMFMVAGIYFLRELLLFVFTKLLISVESKVRLSLMFCLVAAGLSAFLDALTVTAVIITVAVGFYTVYHKVASGKGFDDEHNHDDDTLVHDFRRGDLERFRAFLRSLMMHAAVGTALGGVCTLVGEPQNLLIGHVAGWSFGEFFVRVAPVSMPVVVVGLLTCVLLEKLKWFGYGEELPLSVREILEGYELREIGRRDLPGQLRIVVQGVVAIFLVLALAFHLAEVGLVGLAVIILSTAFNGVTEEHRLGHAFEEALPFTALLVVFFAVVAVIQVQGLFQPVLDVVLAMRGHAQLGTMFAANGLMSMISDNVFVATVYITGVKTALDSGLISPLQFNHLAVAINTGTNIPSIATPNGQAAFLFLLTSGLAPLIRLGYGRMVWMALPYTVTLSLTGLTATLISL